jgi:hypothetical protein
MNTAAYQQLKDEYARLVDDKQSAEQEQAVFRKNLEKAQNAHVRRIQQAKVTEKQDVVDRVNAQLQRVGAVTNTQRMHVLLLASSRQAGVPVGWCVGVGI